MPEEKLDQAGRSSLHYAALENAKEVAKLIKLGADVNRADKQGFTPLHFAAQQNNCEGARLLLEAGATIDAKDAHGATPLFRAVFESRGNGDMIGLLRKWGADPYAKNNHGVPHLSCPAK